MLIGAVAPPGLLWEKQGQPVEVDSANTWKSEATGLVREERWSRDKLRPQDQAEKTESLGTS